MKNQLVLILLILGTFAACKKDDINNPIDDNWEVTQEVNVSSVSATVSISDDIEVIIPQGAIQGNATIKIKKLEKSSLPVATDFEMFEAFEVISSSGKSFAKNLEINIKYNPNSGVKGAINNGAAYYNEDLNKWIPFSDVIVDTVDSKIRIKTNHLCKLGRFSYTKGLGYTDWASSQHFNFYWTEPGVLTNSNYDSPYKSVNVGTDPWYIQDIAFYMETAYKAFRNANLSLPNGKINVYIKDLGSDDGETSFLGNIFINQAIQNSINGYATTAEVLPMACAHELLHYIQDYYYVQLFADKTVKWWLEATAVQADRFVWPTNKKFDAISYSDNLYLNLSKSWDDCKGDPEYYIAGSFLSYMINSRPGTKLSLPEMIVECGDATDVSFIRTILDNMIKTKLSSSGIGEEFYNFIKWAIEGKGDIKLKPLSPTPNPLYPNTKSSIFTDKKQKATHNLTIPHLAVGFFKVLNKTNETQTMVAKVDSKSNQITARAYKMSDNGNAIFIKELSAKDSVVVDLVDSQEWIEIVGVNKHKDDSGDIAVSFKVQEKPLIKNFHFNVSVYCKYKQIQSDGTTTTGTNSYSFYKGSSPCIQKGDTITANWDGYFPDAHEIGQVTFVIQKDKTLSFELTNEWSYNGIVTSTVLKGSGMPQVFADDLAIEYKGDNSSVFLETAWFKTVYPNFTVETTEFYYEPQYPKGFQIIFYYLN